MSWYRVVALEREFQLGLGRWLVGRPEEREILGLNFYSFGGWWLGAVTARSLFILRQPGLKFLGVLGKVKPQGVKGSISNNDHN